MSTEKIPLSSQHRKILTEYLKEVNEVLDKRYPLLTVLLSLAVLIFVLFLIYLYEDYLFSVGLKVLTILPLSAVIIVNIRYFRNQLPAKNLRKLYSTLLEDNHYQALRVRSSACGQYSDALHDYLVFYTEENKELMLRIQDFTIDKEKFPNDNFLIPPVALLDIVGNGLICEGNKIEPVHNGDISKQVLAFGFFERGRVMINNRIY